MRTKTLWSRRLFFASLYFVQGAVLAYIMNFQKPYLSASGVSVDVLGVFTGSLLLPFILKILLGFVSDKWPIGKWGHRKPYMFIGLTVFALSFLGLAQVNPAVNFSLFWAVCWFGVLGLALFDACADGWAVDDTDATEQGTIQSSMLAGKSLGLIGMSLAFGWLASGDNYSLVFLVLSGLAIGINILVLFAKSPDLPLSTRPHLLVGERFLPRGYVLFVLFGVSYSIASYGTDGLLTLHLATDSQADSLAIGYFGTMKGLGAFVGAMLFAGLVRWCGLMRTQTLALIALGFAACLPLLSGLQEGWRAGLWGLTWGLQDTAYLTLAMVFASGRWSATIFALSMIFCNLGTAIGEAVGGRLVHHFGFEATFVTFAVVAWLSLGWIYGLRKILPQPE